MDESDDNGPQTNRPVRNPKHKYMQLLHDVADRRTNHVLIELDDLDQVRASCSLRSSTADIGDAV